MDDRKKIEGIVREGLGVAGVTVNGLKVWRTRKTGGDHKDKEILILLKNPGIKELLPERIAAAITFIELIQNNSDELAIKRVREATSEFLKGQDLEDYVQRVRDEANEFLHIGGPFEFTEEAIEGKRLFVEEFGKELEKVKDRIENGEREIFKENVKIELGYLFSMDAKLADDLNRSVDSEISEELKKELTFKGLLLENINEVTKSGDEWVVAGGKNKLIVRRDEGVLKVYSPGAKEWSSIKRSEVLALIDEEIKSLGVNTEAEITRLEEIEDMKNKIGELEKGMPGLVDLGELGELVLEDKDIKERIERLEKERASTEETNKLNERINLLENETKPLKYLVAKKEKIVIDGKIVEEEIDFEAI